jgi:hypothetical protein
MHERDQRRSFFGELVLAPNLLATDDGRAAADSADLCCLLLHSLADTHVLLTHKRSVAAKILKDLTLKSSPAMHLKMSALASEYGQRLLVEVPVGESDDSGERPCQTSANLHRSFSRSAYLIPPGCNVCSGNGKCADFAGSHELTVAQVTELASAGRMPATIRVDRGEISPSQFMTTVLTPMFQHASRLSIIDGHIFDNSEVVDGVKSRFRLARRYLASLEMLIAGFATTSNRARIVEIFSNMPDFASDDQSQIRLETKCLRDISAWFDELGTQYGVQVRVHVQSRVGGGRYEHDRFLATDHFVVQFGRGIDFLEVRGPEPRVEEINITRWNWREFQKVYDGVRRRKCVR